MPVKISPFNIQAFTTHGAKKIQEMEEERARERARKTIEPELVDHAEEETLDETLVESLEGEPSNEVLEEEVLEEEVLEGTSEEVLEVVQNDAPEDYNAVEVQLPESELSDLDSLSEDELKELAKELKVSHWWTKNRERLISDITEARSGL